MPRIFISYRRADSNDIAERIYDHLANAFGEDSVFKDQYSIKPGEDFREAIRRVVRTVDVLLVLIGPDWLTVTQTLPNGTVVRRIDHPDDWVRREIEEGLNRLTDPDRTNDVQVIPILVRGANRPSLDELPESIRDLAFHQAYPVRGDTDFRRDIGELINHLGGAKPAVPVLSSNPMPFSPIPSAAAHQPVPPPVLLKTNVGQIGDANPDKPPRTGMSTEVKVALIGLVGVIAAAIIAILPNLPPQSTPIPTTKPAVVVPTETDTALPPTSTATSVPPTATPTSVTDTPIPPTNTPIPPTPASTSGLIVGEQAVIAPNPDGYLNLHSATGQNNSVLMQVPVGSAVLVLDGPIFAEDMLWWKLRATNGVIGWTVETGGNRQLLMPFVPTATPTIAVNSSPSMTPIRILPTPTFVGKTYPCDGTVIFTTGALLDQVKVLPQRDALSASPVKQGETTIIVTKKYNDGLDWYKISYSIGKNLGWIPSTFITPSKLCPND